MAEKQKEIIVFTDGMGNSGIQRVLSGLTSSWVKKGHKVSIAYIMKEKENIGDYFWEPDIELIPVNAGSGFFHIYKTLVSFYKNLLNSRPEAIAVSLSVMSNFAIGACAPHVKNKIIISDRNDPRQRPKGRFKQYYRDKAFKRADVLILQTEEVQRYYEERIHRRGIIIPNPINPNVSLVSPSEKRRASVVTASRLNKQKNLPLLLEAFAMFVKDHPEYKLEIYGRGEEENALKDRAAELSISESVLFKGFSKDIYHDIVDCSMYVCSSDYEGISNSLLEALGLGIPTVSTDHPVGGARLLIENEVNGLLVGVGDARGLYQAMCRIAESDELAEQLSRNAVKVRDKYNIDVIADKWLDNM